MIGSLEDEGVFSVVIFSYRVKRYGVAHYTQIVLWPPSTCHLHLLNRTPPRMPRIMEMPLALSRKGVGLVFDSHYGVYYDKKDGMATRILISTCPPRVQSQKFKI